MKTTELKNILFQKLVDENCDFRKSDISIKQTDSKVTVVIKGYENSAITLRKEEDEYFGYSLYINVDDELIAFIDDKKDYDWKSAMIEVGYYIGTRF